MRCIWFAQAGSKAGCLASLAQFYSSFRVGPLTPVQDFTRNFVHLVDAYVVSHLNPPQALNKTQVTHTHCLLFFLPGPSMSLLTLDPEGKGSALQHLVEHQSLPTIAIVISCCRLVLSALAKYASISSCGCPPQAPLYRQEVHLVIGKPVFFQRSSLLHTMSFSGVARNMLCLNPACWEGFDPPPTGAQASVCSLFLNCP